MPDDEKEKKSWGSYFTKKVILILGAVATVLTIMGGIWGFEAHYATNKRVDKVVLSAEKDVEELEVQLAGALQNQQHKSDAKYWQFMVERLTKDLYEMKRQMRRYPEDEVLREDYRALLERLKEAQKRWDESLQKIK